MASLHVICGNCGSLNDFELKVQGEYNDYGNGELKYEYEATLSCNNCSTIHNLNDKFKEENNER